MAFGGKNRVRVQTQVEGVKQATGELAGFRKAFDDLAKNKGAQAVMQGVGLGAGLAGWSALSSGIGMVADAAVASIGAASDLREAMSLTQQTFGENTTAVEKWAAATDDAFSQTEALTFASNFGTAFRNVGMSLDETAAKAQAMTTLAGDLGSAFNTSSEEAAQALRSGLLGESEPMRRFGVFLSEAAVQAEAAAMGMKPLNGRLTEGQKVAARYSLIMKQTAASQGMFGRDSESLADAQKLLNTAMEDLGATIGEELLPVAVDLTRWASQDAVPALRGLIDVLGWVGAAFGGTKKEVQDFRRDAQESGIYWQMTGDQLVATFGEIDGAASIAAKSWDTNSERIGASLGKIEAPTADAEGWLGDLADEVGDTAGTFDELRSAVRKAMDQMVEDKYDPEQLALSLKSAKLELKLNIEKLHELEKIKNPTTEQRKDIIDTKLAISQGKEEIEKLRGQIRTLNGQSVARITAHFNALGKKIDWTSDEARDLVALLKDIDRAESNVNWRGPNQSGGKGGKATGGFVPVGWEGPVGEEGPERAHVVPGGVIFTNRDQSQSERAVMPVSAAAAWTGGSADTASRIPVEIPITLDGREIARVVDQHLYYEAARAPQSTFGG